MPSPKLTIRRVVVDGELTYDQRFYPGLNIVQAVKSGDDPRSTNGCGKTSLVELIQHGLGKRQESKAKFHFAPIIEQLKTLWVEIETNSGIYTIERSLQAITAAARFREGSYVPDIEKLPAETVSIEDMSPLLLGLVGIPQVSVNTQQGEPAPLSFPLLSRAFILHQEDSFGEILSKVQPESRKADIIGFLTGITSLDRFPVEERLGKVQVEMQFLENDVRSITQFLVDNNIPSLVEASGLVENARLALAEARSELRDIQRAIIQSQESDKPGQTDDLRRRLLSVKAKVAQIEQSFIGLQQEEQRIKQLLASLRTDRQKSRHIQASTIQLSSVGFELCPRCLQEITSEMHNRETSARCSLCNRPFIVTSDTLPKRITKTDDIDVQIEEAEEILDSVIKERASSESQLSKIRVEERELSLELEALLSAYVSPSVDRINAQANIVAERQAALARAVSVLEQAQALEKKQEKLDGLRVKFAELQEELIMARAAKVQRRETLRQSYSDVLKAINYPGVRQITLDTHTLMPSINGQLYIHQGTALKGLATVAYHLALLNMARANDTFFPKLLIIDSPNVGDLNEQNHAKLLYYIASLHTQEADSTEFDWQIILTTRYLPQELEQFVCDRISSPDRMLLRSRKT
jgi:hypothetical protein